MFGLPCSGTPKVSEIYDYADPNRELTKASEMIVRYVDGAGKERIKGGADLKSSQAYPKASFGTTCCFFPLVISIPIHCQ